MIKEATVSRGHQAEIYSNKEIISIMNDSLSIQKETLPDYVVFTDKDLYLARQLELLGIPVFNSSAAITTSDDKIKTYQLLAKVGVQIPKTIFATKTFGLPHAFDDAFFNFIIETFGFPVIIKEAFGSFGRSEEHTSELQSRGHLVCRLLL